MAANAEDSMGWILDLLIAEKPARIDFVARVDLQNRYKESQRCRDLACQAVNKLAPLRPVCGCDHARFSVDV